MLLFVGTAYLMLALRIMLLPDCCAAALPALPAGSPNTFQKRSVSSAPAVTTLLPSGDWAMCSTRAVWPVSSAACTAQHQQRHVQGNWLLYAGAHRQVISQQLNHSRPFGDCN
jgi:hypothetical protein